MSGILDLLNGPEGKSLIDGVGGQLGLNKKTATTALASAIPLILGAMRNNASTQDGTSGILGALGNKHSGGILDNLGSILGGSNIDEDVMKDGGGILGHVFGGQENNAAHAIGKSNGIDMRAAMDIMKVAAPVVMGYLGKKAMSNNVSDQNGLNGLLGGILGDDNDKQQEMASKIQDFNNNDLSVDDLAGLISEGGKSGGILGALGKMFG
ncbi:MAG: DUF937 domain-containing protein [Bacteroidota bacterium]